MRKPDFTSAYRDHLVMTYPWAADTAKLVRFLESVRRTIYLGENTWNHDGAAVTAAWKKIGGKGKPTLKALRALED